jgi:galactokinase
MSSAKSLVAFGPGRVNLIGEHTDYNGGLALPFAISEGVTVTATPIDGVEIEALARDHDETDRFDASTLTKDDAREGWRAFVRGTAAELIAGGVTLAPVRLEIAGDVPEGSGLSSSAALEVALSLALLGREPDDRVALAQLCSRVENDWVGADTGLLDQLASLLGEDDHALRIDFATLVIEPVPLRIGDWRLVTLDSGSRHSHSSGDYNQRWKECRQAAELLGVEHLSQADPEAAAQLPDPLDRRVRHVLEENARVDATVRALHDDDLETVGRLLDASHASLRDLYDASVPAVEDTVARLKAAGAAGARMVGGGFGGHVLALMPPAATPPSEAVAVEPGPGGRLL